tara:strand:- start:891 stop:1208 length:318 start_codon:yes stop_codon:yes gene_type:complete
MITISDSAATKMKSIIEESDSIGIRPGVQGGGCSGFSYKLELAKEEREGDRVIEDKGVKLYIDKKSYLYLIGTEIDWIDDLLQAGFKFVNPNAKRTCGCGESFSV